MTEVHLGLTARIVDRFLTSNLAVILLIASLLAGGIALLVTPREEDPQIVVPMADVLIQMPGASAAEVENLVTINLEKKLWEIDGVEHVYSISRPGFALVTVRFYVGEDRTASLVKIYNKIQSNIDAVPSGVSGWVVKPVEINDVPILTLTLYSATATDADLRRVGDEILHRLQEVSNTAASSVVGGRRRQIRVLLDPERLAARGAAPLDVVRVLRGADANLRAGEFARENREFVVDSGPFIESARELETVVLAAPGGTPVSLRDVADVIDGPEETTSYTRLRFGPAVGHLRDAAGDTSGASFPAVTLAFAKRRGTNAVRVAEGLLEKVADLKRDVIPSDVQVLVTRNYGETANEKVDELVSELLIAVAIIVVLLALTLGTREAFIVALAVPMTLAVTLLGNFLVGYTINRVTLFALILSLGLLVDDPIVDVENIHRHFRLRTHPPREATLVAVDEVRPPTILATFTVIVSFLPMLFVGGMMGPYMRPMPFNVPLAMLVSLLVAFTVTPWAAYRLLRHEYDEATPQETEGEGRWVRNLYRRVVSPLLDSRRRTWMFLGVVALAFLGSVLLVVVGLVPVKMLPFDNKNELQLVIDTPEGTPLEATDAVVRDLEDYLATVAEVTDFESYVGLSSPFDFNGMVRHYYLRRGPSVADIRVNLVPKDARKQKSHGIALRIRPEVERIAAAHGATLKIVETPPGPPVFATVVAEVYGPVGAAYADVIGAAKQIRQIFTETPGVVDIDDSSIAPQPRIVYRLDRQKAGAHGIAVADVAQTLALALGGVQPARAHIATERTPLEIDLRLPRPLRSSLANLLALRVRGADAGLVALSELGRAEESVDEQPIYRKDLQRFVMVTADMAGRSPVNAVLDMQQAIARRPLPADYRIEWAGEGEWNITVDVFRDLGLAFGVALLLIWVLLVAQTGSMLIPVIIMVAIPLTMIGIMPGFWLLNVLTDHPVAGYANPTFFTATAMIGMIALAGIVVRNSIILIDFIHLSQARGRSLRDAILEAGAVRFRPILLTASAAMLGSIVITLDPIFSGLAWSFIFGIFASTAFSLVVVPVIYNLVYASADGVKQGGTRDDCQ
jgi:multidrug efflux pump subunit AcrB